MTVADHLEELYREVGREVDLEWDFPESALAAVKKHRDLQESSRKARASAPAE